MKKLWLMISVVAMLGWVNAVSHAALLSNYPFDTNATNLVDASTSGTFQNEAAIVADSAIGAGALSLDGVNDYVQLTASSYPNSTAGRWTGSMTFWMKTTTATSWQPVLGHPLSGFPLFEVWLQGDTDQIDLWNRGSAGSFTKKSAADTAFNDGTWHQVTVAWNTTTGASGTGTVDFYLDGALNISNPAGGNNTWTSGDALNPWPNPLEIGRSESSYYFTGQLDDIAVWSTKLSATEARAMYEVGNTLDYNATDIDALFTVFAGGTGSSGATSDGTTWYYTTGLTGGAGYAVNGGTAVILDGLGNGVTSILAVPEPGVLLLVALGGLLVAKRRRGHG